VLASLQLGWLGMQSLQCVLSVLQPLPLQLTTSKPLPCALHTTDEPSRHELTAPGWQSVCASGMPASDGGGVVIASGTVASLTAASFVAASVVASPCIAVPPSSSVSASGGGEKMGCVSKLQAETNASSDHPLEIERDLVGRRTASPLHPIPRA
jgi:hypothetical protein